MQVDVQYRRYFSRTAISTRYVTRGLLLGDALLLRDSLALECTKTALGHTVDQDEISNGAAGDLLQEVQDRIDFASYVDDKHTEYRNALEGFEEMLHVVTRARDSELILQHCTNRTLLAEEIDYCTDLLARNMRALYVQAAWTLDLRKKREELLHPNARIILVKQTGDVPTKVGFVHFRFAREDYAAVLYLYGKRHPPICPGD